MGKKWSASQLANFKRTMALKRQEREAAAANGGDKGKRKYTRRTGPNRNIKDAVIFLRKARKIIEASGNYSRSDLLALLALDTLEGGEDD